MEAMVETGVVEEIQESVVTLVLVLIQEVVAVVAVFVKSYLA
jgi:hypothetical protein